MKLRVKYVKSLSVRAIGLKTLGIASCPDMLVFMPIFGHLPVEHRIE